MKYRPEIDGLRAVAVLPVVFFHAGLGALQGGFVGVDIFFVISGYLITSILIREYQTNTFSIVGFYERRARRLLPALFVVVAFCIPIAWKLLLPSEFVDFGQSLVGVATFSSNILFWRESGYFDVSAELKPLLHTWSLAVEEQFYIVFPLLLGLLLRFGKAWMVVGLALFAFVSLTLAQFAHPEYSSASFYLLPTRMWELLLGALISQLPPTIVQRVGASWAQVLSLLGLGMVIYAIFAFNHQTSHPALPTLVPVIGTCMIITFTVDGTWVGRFLSWRPMVVIGLLSYSAYLWHQPLIVFTKHLIPRELTLDVTFVLVVLTFACAYVSWRFVERPFRSKGKVSSRTVMVLSMSGLFALAGTGVLGYLKGGSPERTGLPGYVAASFERTQAGSSCFSASQIHVSESWLCDVGSEGAPQFALFGDSHARSLLPAFEEAARSSGVSGVFAGSVGCIPFQQVYALRPDQDERNCRQLNERMLDAVRSGHIPRVYLAARWTYYTEGGYSGNDWSYLSLSKDGSRSPEASREAFRQGLQRTVEAYQAVGAEVVLIEQVPQQLVDPRRIVKNSLSKGSLDLAAVERYSVPVSRHQALQQRVTRIFNEEEPNVRRLDPSSLFCIGKRTCMASDTFGSFYYDEDHLSEYGARKLVALVNSSLVELKPFSEP